MKRIIPFAALLLIQVHCFSQSVEKLSVGDKISRNMESNASHEYTVSLKQGQFAHINLTQKDVDVKIMTYHPNGNQIEEFDSNNGSNGDELVLIDADTTGVYKIKVVPFGKKKKEKKGWYELEIIAINTDLNTHLNQLIDALYTRKHLPGFAISIVNKDSVLFKKAKGYASIEEQKPYTETTVQNIASISKTFIGISLMILVEEGKLSLDTEINSILPFKISNPYFPNTPITVRHLATHSSTINDFPCYYTKAGVLLKGLPIELDKYPKDVRKTIKLAAANEDMTMVDFIKKMLYKNGKWYKKKNFFKRPPGQEWFYSNVGAAIAAYIVEIVSETPYDEFVKNRIFKSYNLQSANWNSSTIDPAVLASNYMTGNIPLPKFKSLTYPDDGIYINSKDLTTYLMHLMKGYYGDDNLIKSSSFNEMMKVQFTDPSGDYKGREVGLFWEVSKSGNMGHNGGNTGVISMMYFHPENKVGYTMLCNMDPTENGNALAEFERTFITIRRYATQL